MVCGPGNGWVTDGRRLDEACTSLQRKGPQRVRTAAADKANRVLPVELLCRHRRGRYASASCCGLAPTPLQPLWRLSTVAGLTISTEQTADLLQAVLTDLASVVGSIRADQQHLPTPCTDLDVEQLRDHVLGWLATFEAGFSDPDGQAPGQTRRSTGRRPTLRAVRAAADQLDRAVRAGATERPLLLGEGAMPGDLALGMILWEYQVHGWDLAVATGQPWTPPADAAEGVSGLRSQPAHRGLPGRGQDPRATCRRGCRGSCPGPADRPVRP